MAAAMVRQQSGRQFRSGRFRGRHGSGEENVQLDFAKDPDENVKEVLCYIILQHGYSKAKKLGYLNAFVKLLDRCTDRTKLGLPLKDIMKCLMVNMLNAPKEVRAASLRVMKHLIIDEESLELFLDLHLDYIVARSLDMCLDNEIERIHAQKLVRRIGQVVSHKLPKSLVFPVVAIGSDGAEERDRMVRISMASICELCYYNPELVDQCGGVGMLLNKILDCHQYPRINESLVCTVLHLLNHPKTRHFIHINTGLEQLLAPFTDCHFCSCGEAEEVSSEEKENRFNASKMAIITIMRSWPGIIRFCRPDGTGLQSLVGILYLPFTDVRQGIVELVYELFHLTIPEWTKDFSEALISIDPSRMVDDWRLTDGFVAEEGKVLLPNLATIRPNLVENHTALLLAAWIRAGILDALVEVIITTDTELFIRTIILLGELLHLANQLLPPECGHHSHYLPSLMNLASSFDIPNRQRHRASVAVTYLTRIHTLKKRGAIPCSLYLDQILKQSGSYKDKPVSFSIQKEKMLDVHVRKISLSSEELANQILRDTQVLNTKENKKWDLDLIGYILKWPDDKLQRVEDQNHLRFIKRLVFFYKPTNHMFSRMASDNELERKLAVVGCQLVDFLVKCDQEDLVKQLMDLLVDIGLCLSEVALQRMAPESVLSAGNVINTLSHYYFLLIGRFSQTTKGDRYLEKAGIYQYLLDIVAASTQDSYVKLIVSSLYFGKEGNSRAVLSKALCASSESGRLYSTKFLRVLLRAKVRSFTTWGIELLVGQLYDQSRSVAMTALSILDEACEDHANLRSIVQMKPSFLHLGEKGVMMLCRYMSTASGFKFLTEANYTMNELKKWHTSFNTRYVTIVDDLLNSALTTYEKTYEGSYTRRSSKKRRKKDVYVPVHLYGQLVQHKDSFSLLRQQTYIENYFECVRCLELRTDEDIIQLKTALWVVGHISTSSWGISWLEDEKLVPEVMRLAEECAVYSIRGTAFFVLGLMASTREGAEVLTQYGWESRWTTRTERWPLVEDRATLLEVSMEDNRSEAAFNMGRSTYELGSPVSNLDFIAEEHFHLGKPVKSWSRSISDSGEQSGGRYERESGVHIPGVQSTFHTHDIRTFNSRAKSQTLPADPSGYKKYQSLPLRSQTFRSVSMSPSKLIEDRTQSVEHLPDRKFLTLNLDAKDRSQSLNLDVSSNDKSSERNRTSKTVDDTVMQSKSSKPVSLKITIGDEEVDLEQLDSSSPKITIESAASFEHDSDTDSGIKFGTNVPNLKPVSVTESESGVRTESNKDNADGSSKANSSLNNDRPPRLKLKIGDSSEKEDMIATEASTLDSQLVDDKVSVISIKPEQNQKVSISVTDTDSDFNLESDNFVIGDTKTSGASRSDGNLNSSGNSEMSQISDGCQGEPKTSKSLERSDSHEGFVKKIVSYKDERSSSSDSSKTSKSRTDSFNTDSVTSGIGSYDSCHQGVSELHPLTPIPSSTSLENFEVQLRPKDTDVKDRAHHSMALRRLSNLSRVPSTRRQSSPGVGLLPISKFFDFSENAITYTTARDAIGYATLRALMKQRQISSDADSDYGLNNLYDTSSIASTSRRPSIDSTYLENKRPLSHTQNPSGLSLSEMESPWMGNHPRVKLETSTIRVSNSLHPDQDGHSVSPDLGPNCLQSLSADDISRCEQGESMLRNLSGVSLSDMDSPGVGLTPKAMLYQQRPHTGEAEFVGIALPVDINMIFEVHEGEDKRTLDPSISRQSSFVETDLRSVRSDSGLEDMNRMESGLVNVHLGSSVRSRTTSSSTSPEFSPMPLSAEHNPEICLQCGRLRSLDVSIQISELAEEGYSSQSKSDIAGSSIHLLKTAAENRSRAGSANEPISEVSGGSQTSTASDSSTNKKLSLDNPVGRTLLRKEILRFVINLSSSVGVKGAEQGLLNLKQTFPKAFQDLCFFSEVSNLLGSCSFRLKARRFIQELFEDMDTSKMIEEARDILGVDETADKFRVEKSLSEDFDDFG